MNRYQIKKYLDKYKVVIGFAVALVIFWLNIPISTGPSSSSEYKTQAVEPKFKLPSNSEKYAISVLKKYVEGQEPPAIEFNWNQFMNLDPFFEEVREKKIKGMSCKMFAEKTGKPRGTIFRCEDTPKAKLPVKFHTNMELIMSKTNRLFMKAIHLATVMPPPQKVTILLPGHPRPALEFPVSGDLEIKFEDGLLVEEVNRLAPPATKPATEKYDLLPLTFSDFDTQSLEIPAGSKDPGPEFRYFSEAYLFDFFEAQLADWRFFSLDILENPELRDRKMEVLIRAWIHFAESIGLKWWLAEEALMAWNWNGFHAPTINHAQVNVPVSELVNKLMAYNRTVVYDFKDATDGLYGAYYLDVNPFSVNPTSGKYGKYKLNAVDARFIDIETGLKIEIFGMRAYVDSSEVNRDLTMGQILDAKKAKAKVGDSALIYDKNLNMMDLKLLTPLVPTHFENAVTYIPSHHKEILKTYYPQDKDKSSLVGYKYHRFLKVWLPSELCMSKVPWMPTTEKDDQICLQKHPEIKELVDKYAVPGARHLSEQKCIESAAGDASKLKKCVLKSNYADRRALSVQ